jgi:transposase
MKRKRIRRKVAALDTSNQIALFEQAEASTPEAGPAAGSPRKQAPRFEEPDPALIRINQMPLDQLLEQVGQGAALKIRAWLGQMSFSEFEQAYRAGGRPAYAPRAMVGVILSGILQGITSLRDLERFARTDLGCWWVSGGIMPDHSILGRFIQRHAGLLSEAFFDQLTHKVLKLTGSGTGVVAGDGTVIEAAASRYRQMRAEALAQALQAAREAAQAAVDGEPSSARVEQLERAQSILDTRRQERQARGKDPAGLSINPHEPEAVVQPQKDKQRYAASYKPSVLANDKRVIVAAQVHASSETAVVERLLDQAQGHGKIDTALFDAGYFATDILVATAQRQIELLCPEGQSQGSNWNKHSDKQLPKSAFDYQGTQDCYRCPAGHSLTPVGRYSGNASAAAYTEYATRACAGCALRDKCTRSPQGRRIKRYAIDAQKDALRAKMAQAQARQRYAQRQAMVEPVFSALRGRQGLQRFRRNGLAAVRVEFALHAMAYNLSRALACALGSPFARLINALLRHGYTKLCSITARPTTLRHGLTLRSAALVAQ